MTAIAEHPAWCQGLQDVRDVIWQEGNQLQELRDVGEGSTEGLAEPALPLQLP